MRSFKALSQQLAPFLIIGIAVALFVSILIFLSYVVLWGLVVGGVLWLIAIIRQNFFTAQPKHAKGKIIEHEQDDEP